MKKSWFSDEMIIATLKEGDAGGKVMDMCRKHGMSAYMPIYHSPGRWGWIGSAKASVGCRRGSRLRCGRTGDYAWTAY